MNLKEFGDYFSEIRKREGYKSQRDLAEKSGVSNATISRLESGVTKPSPEVLRELANCFTTVTYEELMQNAGYLNIENVLDEYQDVYELKKKLNPIYEEVIHLTRTYAFYINKNRFLDSLADRGITIENVASNFFEKFDFELMRNKSEPYPIKLEEAIRFSRAYRIKFNRIFYCDSLNASNDMSTVEILFRIDDLIEQDIRSSTESVKKEQQKKEQNTNVLSHFKQSLLQNLSDDEVDYLYQQLVLYRSLNLKPKNQ